MQPSTSLVAGDNDEIEVSETVQLLMVRKTENKDKKRQRCQYLFLRSQRNGIFLYIRFLPLHWLVTNDV